MGVKRVVSRHEAIARVRAAVDARDEGSDILILARTDARQAISLQVTCSPATDPRCMHNDGLAISHCQTSLVCTIDEHVLPQGASVTHFQGNRDHLGAILKACGDMWPTLS